MNRIVTVLRGEGENGNELKQALFFKAGVKADVFEFFSVFKFLFRNLQLRLIIFWDFLMLREISGHILVMKGEERSLGYSS
jgi:hypothetical protein